MTAVFWAAYYDINPGQRAAFEQAARHLIDVIEATEPGCLSYQYYITDDDAHCVALERYASEEAALAHVTGEGPKLLPAMLQYGEITGMTVFTPITHPELRRLLTQWGTTYADNVAGFER